MVQTPRGEGSRIVTVAQQINMMTKVKVINLCFSVEGEAGGGEFIFLSFITIIILSYQDILPKFTSCFQDSKSLELFELLEANGLVMSQSRRPR